MANGQVDIRHSKRHDKFRLRFYAVAHDQLEVILPALRLAREELNTMYDSVALEHICMAYLMDHTGKPKQ